ncbi:hypothetical protein NMG29_00320 [Streptomyces cocklensis]|jgi:hypothetical protein|uniref:hypothetical protein n=1 Tax=Actinacidiphila cocklensis TaxID=887465 RepID=UPI00203A4F0F|nr:hypothetical protein [Actinacidiphila cocklensis]MDD1056694.1 hypothetical protein [Actinacidiphila cocklensis]WSX77852.1 hypothetical protein OH826_30840 [Streptomyces sp. NBC_00899]
MNRLPADESVVVVGHPSARYRSQVLAADGDHHVGERELMDAAAVPVRKDLVEKHGIDGHPVGGVLVVDGEVLHA